MEHDEVLRLLNLAESMDIRDFVIEGPDGEAFDWEGLKASEILRFVRQITIDNERKIVDIQLTNGQRAGKGAVYLMRAENGLYKIGKAVNASRRLSNIKTDSPVEVELVWYFEGLLYSEIEKELHKQYADKRVRGEWFSLSDEDVAAIMNRYERD